ncbi:N-formylglutamate amidohydrolase [Patescibacteria group bacterium]|nr:N-formylglutamate amidohydrolase [Patescibacteria group bacterium]
MKFYKILKLKKVPVVCNIPHSSINIPQSFKGDFIIPEKKLIKEAKELADLFTDELYANILKKYGGIVSGVSRLATDIERFEDDKNEPMSKVGMGALYVKSQEGEIIREFSDIRREKLLNLFYRQYHKTLTSLVAQSLRQFGRCVIIDCHSFPSRPRDYEPDQKDNRPDICIGTDKYHTPALLKKALVGNFKNKGFSVKVNSPFKGTMIPLKYYGKDKRVDSVLIEVNRKLYMNERNFRRKKVFPDIGEVICDCVSSSIKEHLK